MKKGIIIILFLLTGILYGGFSSKSKDKILHPKYLRCENLVDPLGMEPGCKMDYGIIK
jgi:hypothetical protein